MDLKLLDASWDKPSGNNLEPKSFSDSIAVF